MANKEISRLSKKVTDIQYAVRSMNYSNAESAVSRIAWIAYDWKD